MRQRASPRPWWRAATVLVFCWLRDDPGGCPRSGRLGTSERDLAIGPARGARVELRHVARRFGGRDGGVVVVDDLSLHVEPGEICVLVGPSGCGKTTTLKMVNRLVEPSAGQILIDGVDVTAVDPVRLRRGIGYVIQQIGLFPHQTIADNIAAVPRLLGWPSERIRPRVDRLLELVGLEPAAMRDRYPAQLSGGERQRVGVARAIAAEPPLLLMDEPFGAVDPLVRERLQDEFLRLQRRLGTTVLFVTHDIDEAIKLGTRVAVFRTGGRLAQVAPPAELLARPIDDYVARFVGADRALKRLALIPVSALTLDPTGPLVARPVLAPETSLRDALATLLEVPGQRGSVVAADGRYLGAVTVAAIAAALQDGAPPAGPPGVDGPAAPVDERSPRVTP